MKTKMALFALTTGMVALSSGSCFFQWLGDTAADVLWFRGID